MKEVKPNIFFNPEDIEVKWDDSYPKGWYFSNEASQLYGPFDSMDDAETTFNKYCEEYL